MKQKQNTKGGDNKSRFQEPAPKNNEPHVKIIERKVYIWCAKCKRWQSSHTPENHGNKDKKLTVDQLKEMKKALNDGTKKNLADFNFCEVVSSEGINL